MASGSQRMNRDGLSTGRGERCPCRACPDGDRGGHGRVLIPRWPRSRHQGIAQGGLCSGLTICAQANQRVRVRAGWVDSLRLGPSAWPSGRTRLASVLERVQIGAASSVGSPLHLMFIRPFAHSTGGALLRRQGLFPISAELAMQLSASITASANAISPKWVPWRWDNGCSAENPPRYFLRLLRRCKQTRRVALVLERDRAHQSDTNRAKAARTSERTRVCKRKPSEGSHALWADGMTC
jgi:hypothetical protein